MPEVVTLLCDLPDCPSPKRGTKLYVITRLGERHAEVEVILCRDHAAPVEGAMGSGRSHQEARDERASYARHGGMSEEALLRLHVD